MRHTRQQLASGGSTMTGSHLGYMTAGTMKASSTTIGVLGLSARGQCRQPDPK